MNLEYFTTDLLLVFLGTTVGFLIGFLIMLVFTEESENEYSYC
jgi:hypothetical protein